MILRICVCIPAFDNPNSIAPAVRDVLERTEFEILIVDDGSRRSIRDILEGERLLNSRVRVLRFGKNLGKGAALQAGFDACLSRGFTHMLTMDGDGQHLAAEIPKLVEAAREHPWDLIIGNRLLESETVPGISKFGRKFSNFWVDYQTGSKVKDSQSGFRVYPLFHVQNLKFWTRKFDFEIEVLIRLMWDNVSIREVPVEVHYPPPHERISHFRKFRDNLRISLLNTALVILSLLKSRQAPRQVALAVAVGVFIGCTPFFGLHTFIVAGTAFLFRLNAVYMWVGSQISVPPLVPALFMGSLTLGEMLTGQAPSSAADVTKNYFFGAFALGVPLAIFGGLAAYAVAHRLHNRHSGWNGRTRGGRFGNGFLRCLTRQFGLGPAYLCLYFIIPYFYVFAPTARRSANEYWKLSRPQIGWAGRQWLVMRQLFRFGQVLLDRLYQSQNSKLRFESNPNGIENIVSVRQGLILLSAHVGAWDLAAALLKQDGLTSQMHVVHYESKGPTFNKLKGGHDHEHLRSIVSNTETQPILKIRDLLNSGSPVGLMGDRPLSQNFELVPFLGRLAPFDITPFRLAAACEAKLLFTFGFKGQGHHYDFFASPARRYQYGAQNKSLQCLEWATEYALELEKMLMKYPEQWFNFFPFWSSRPRSSMSEPGGPPRNHLREELHRQNQERPESAIAPTSNGALESQL